MTQMNRFFSKVEMDPNGGCWLWSGCVNGSLGYGYFKYETGTKAHRFSYEKFVGRIPDGLYVCHRCDIPSCVNPDHLWLGTPKQNSQDREKKGRHGVGYTRLRRRYGESFSFAKLSNEDVLFIRSSSLSRMELAAMFPVTYSVICRIKKGKSRVRDHLCCTLSLPPEPTP